MMMQYEEDNDLLSASVREGPTYLTRSPVYKNCKYINININHKYTHTHTTPIVFLFLTTNQLQHATRLRHQLSLLYTSK